jgi:hypothetical protein
VRITVTGVVELFRLFTRACMGGVGSHLAVALEHIGGAAS